MCLTYPIILFIYFPYKTVYNHTTEQLSVLSFLTHKLSFENIARKHDKKFYMPLVTPTLISA